MRHFPLLLLLLAAACTARPLPPSATPSPASPPVQYAPNPTAQTPAPGPAHPVSLLVGGDVTVGQNYQTYFDEQVGKGRTREEMFAYGFKEVKAVADAADLFLVNLECPFTESDDKLPKNFNFRARPELV